jgi:hypothetical protein
MPAAVLSLPALALAGALLGTPPQAPPLPLIGRVVHVATEAQLQTAIRQLASNTTIVLAPGTYHLTRTLSINGNFVNVGIRGGTDDRDAVVLAGNGMTRTDDSVQFGIWTGGQVDGVTIANLTIRDVPFHAIIFNAGTQKPHVFNVHVDTGQQFIKSNPDAGAAREQRPRRILPPRHMMAKDDYTNEWTSIPAKVIIAATCSGTSWRPRRWPDRPCSFGTTRPAPSPKATSS